MTLKRGVLNTTGMLLLALAVFYSMRFWPQQLPLLPANGSTAIDPTQPDYVITDFHAIDLDESGRLRYELTATRLEHFPEPDRAELVAPDMIFYRNARQQDVAPTAPWQLNAETGVISDKGKRLDLAGGVRVARLVEEDSGRTTMETSKLTVLGEQELALTSMPVLLRSPQAQLTGTGMRIDMKHGQLTLHAQVRGSYEPAR